MAGTLGVYNAFAGGTWHIDDDDFRIMARGLLPGPRCRRAVRPPRQLPQDRRHPRATATATTDDGYANVTAMYFRGEGSFSTDQPLPAPSRKD